MEHYHPKIINIMKSSKYYIIRFTMPPQVGKTVECLSYLSLFFLNHLNPIYIYDVNFLALNVNF